MGTEIGTASCTTGIDRCGPARSFGTGCCPPLDEFACGAVGSPSGARRRNRGEFVSGGTFGLPRIRVLYHELIHNIWIKEYPGFTGSCPACAEWAAASKGAKDLCAIAQNCLIPMSQKDRDALVDAANAQAGNAPEGSHACQPCPPSAGQDCCSFFPMPDEATEPAPPECQKKTCPS
jgi:hypothetical protein